MKKTLTIAAITSIIAVLFSCRKPTELIPSPTPIDNKPDTSSFLQLSVSGAAASHENLFVLMSLETSGGQPVITNKKLAVQRDQDVYLTDKIAVARGSYKLTKLLLTTAADTALYAAPKSQTPKAPQVPAPLALAVEITRPAVTKAAVQVLAIHDTDAPESYGYTNDDFGYLAFIPLHATISIRVGTVLYDSLPGTITVDAVNAAGTHWRKELGLTSGLNKISVPEKYTSYHFEMSKWNTTDTKTLARQQLRPNGLLAFSSSGDAKRLAIEDSYIETPAGYITDSRTTYIYENNRLIRVSYLHKPVDASTLSLSNVHKLTYTNNTLDTIKRYDAFNNLQGYTTFTYWQGLISNIMEKNSDQVTGAAVAYFESNGTKTIEADYLYSNGNAMSYRMDYRNGNKVSDFASSSTSGGESATYSYDNNINPYQQLGYPTLLFSRNSQNNLLLEQRNYSGNFPSAVAYKWEYRYDDDGYPYERIVSYKGYGAGQHLYRIKTNFIYH